MVHGGSRARRVRTWTAAAALGLALGAAQPAAAQTKEELDQARVAFQEGVALMAANNCAAALPKFQAVAKVKRTAQVSFNIAECEERLGKLLAALGNYRLAAASAEGDKKARDVASKVGERITGLEERIPKLQIKRGENAETATILLDGTELGAEIGGEVPVDPGSHAVIARIGDREVFRETVTLEEKQSKTLEVVLEALPPMEQGPKPPVDQQPIGPAPDAPKPDEGSSRVPGIVVLSAGVVSAALGGVFLGLRGGAISELDELCGGDETCPASAEATADDGKLYTGLAEVTFALGAVGIVTGIVMIATSGPADKPAEAGEPSAARKRSRSAARARPRAEVVPSAPGADVGGMSVVGRF